MKKADGRGPAKSGPETSSVWLQGFRKVLCRYGTEARRDAELGLTNAGKRCVSSGFPCSQVGIRPASNPLDVWIKLELQAYQSQSAGRWNSSGGSPPQGTCCEQPARTPNGRRESIPQGTVGARTSFRHACISTSFRAQRGTSLGWKGKRDFTMRTPQPVRDDECAVLQYP